MCSEMSQSFDSFNESFMDRVSAFDFHDPYTIHDRVLLVEGKKFYVQSGLLIVWSEFFRALFKSQFKEYNEAEVKLSDVSADEFHVFLQVVYPGFFEVHASDIESLIELSHRFLAPNVLEICKRFIEKEFQQLDKGMLYKVAIRHEMESLKKKAYSFIEKNIKSLNWINLLKLAFEHDLSDLKDLLQLFIYTAEREAASRKSRSSVSLEDLIMNIVPIYDFRDPKTVHDRVLLVEGEKFYIESGYIVVWSEFFRALFMSEFKEKDETEVELFDVTAEDFNIFLQIIYPGSFLLRVSHIESLIELSHRFLAPKVLEICVQCVEKEFDQLDKAMLYKVATRYEMESLKKKAYSFIEKNIKSLDWIHLLKLAFEPDLTDLKEILQKFIYSADREMRMYRCRQCILEIQRTDCKHTRYCSEPLTRNYLIAKHLDEILKLPEEIKNFILISSVNGGL